MSVLNFILQDKLKYQCRAEVTTSIDDIVEVIT